MSGASERQLALRLEHCPQASLKKGTDKPKDVDAGTSFFLFYDFECDVHKRVLSLLTQHERTAGEKSRVFSRRLVVDFPVGDDAATEDALNVVGNAQVEKSRSGQRRTVEKRGGEVLIEGPQTDVFPFENGPLFR